jgi:hypothetical protein
MFYIYLSLVTSAYINSHIASLSEDERKKRWNGWVHNFRKGCKYEVDFTHLASPGKFPAYNILPLNNGLYTIRSYRRGNPYLVSSKPTSVTTSQTVTQEEGLVRDISLLAYGPPHRY